MAIYPANYKAVLTETEATRDLPRDFHNRPYVHVWAYSHVEARTKARKACPVGARIVSVEREGV